MGKGTHHPPKCVLEYFHPRTEWDDVGGLDELKRWLKNRGRLYLKRKRSALNHHGALLLGVPGCGKASQQKLSLGCGVSPSYASTSAVFSRHRWESEANMRKALQVAQAISPCILWIDEIEKGMAGYKVRSRFRCHGPRDGYFLT